MISTNIYPVVSVIVPTFNRAGLIIDAVNSVFEQSYRPIELIVVDDGSIDETRSLISQWVSMIENSPHSEGFSFIYERKENAGAPSARNLGFKISSGDYIQYLDSDDVLRPEKISNAISTFLMNPGIDLVYSKGEIADIDKIDAPPTIFSGANLELNPCVSEVAINMSNTILPVFKRKVVKDTGPWNESLLALQDWEFFARAMKNVSAAKATGMVECTLRVHSGPRISRPRKKQLSSELTRMKAIASVLKVVLESDQDKRAVRHLLRLYVSSALASQRLNGGAAARQLVREEFKPLAKRYNFLAFYLFLNFMLCIPAAFNRVLYKLAKRN